MTRANHSAPEPDADSLFDPIEAERSQLRRAASLMAIMQFALLYDCAEEQERDIDFAGLAALAYELTNAAMLNLDIVELKKKARAQASTSVTD